MTAVLDEPLAAAPGVATRARRALPRALATATGFAGLGYQVVWTQQGALWLGQESAAVLAVVAAFLGGLAASALLLGDAVARSARPRCWLAAAEAAAGLWSLALALLLGPVGAWLQALTGLDASPWRQWGVAFLGMFVLLLPATAAMGVALPALERASTTAADAASRARGVAGLYAANTAGALLGVLATAFLLVPHLGLAGTAATCCALDLGVALIAWRALPGRVPPAAVAPPRSLDAGGRAALVRLGAAGLLGIALEVLGVRVLRQVCEDTVYTFALILAVYLAGSAGGAALWARAASRWPDPAQAGTRLALGLAAAGAVGATALWSADDLHAALAAHVDGVAGALVVEALLAVAVFALPTVAMGALFAHLCGQALAGGASVGRAFGVNTLGAALAPALVGVVAVPALGPGLALLATVAGALALLPRTAWRAPPAWIATLAAGVALVVAPPLRIVDVPEGGRVVRYADGATAAVSVVEDAGGVARLRIDNREQEGSSASVVVDGRMALLPLRLHPDPHRALFLALGTGVTAATAAADPGLEVDVAELVPEVVDASPLFVERLAFARPGALHVRTADARRVVRAAGPAYDVIVADNVHPARSGTGALYTTEHFRAVRARLAPGGVFCQWLPLHQLDLETTRSIVRAYLAAFPHAAALLASNSLDTPTLGLVGRADDGRFDAAVLAAALPRAHGALAPADLGIDDDMALLGSLVAGPGALARFAGDAPENTDDHPVVVYRAPFVAYAPDSRPRDRLMALLQAVDVAPGEVVDAAPALAARLAAYRVARVRFLDAGRAVRPVADPAAMLAQVGGPLLDVLRTSPDFRPAYDPLLRLGLALAQRGDARGVELLEALARVQPARREAGEALARVGAG